jgi:hypothetical protein
VIVDPLTLKTKTEGGVYPVGGVANYCDRGIISTGNGTAPVCTRIGIDIAKAAGWRAHLSKRPGSSWARLEKSWPRLEISLANRQETF